MDELVGLALLFGIGYVLLKTPVGTEADALYWYTVARVSPRYTTLAIAHLQAIQQQAQSAGNSTVYSLATQYLERLQGGPTASGSAG
jgi:hypothetical protein